MSIKLSVAFASRMMRLAPSSWVMASLETREAFYDAYHFAEIGELSTDEKLYAAWCWFVRGFTRGAKADH